VKFGVETTYLWACAHQVESMNALFVEEDCFGLNQVTLQCSYFKPDHVFTIIKRNLDCHESSALRRKKRLKRFYGASLALGKELLKLKKFLLVIHGEIRTRKRTLSTLKRPAAKVFSR